MILVKLDFFMQKFSLFLLFFFLLGNKSYTIRKQNSNPKIFIFFINEPKKGAVNSAPKSSTPNWDGSGLSA